jgi:DsbC/DsbD-like thiol-disulfide interchange protein
MSSISASRTSAALRLLGAWLLAAALPLGAAAQGLLGGPTASATVVQSDQARAEIVAHAPDGAGPGQQVWVGLQLTHAPEWHTYWKNAGDSGLPTELRWTLPPGVSAGEIAWPTPRKFPIGNLANYGYDGTVVLPVPS